MPALLQKDSVKPPRTCCQWVPSSPDQPEFCCRRSSIQGEKGWDRKEPSSLMRMLTGTPSSRGQTVGWALPTVVISSLLQRSSQYPPPTTDHWGIGSCLMRFHLLVGTALPTSYGGRPFGGHSPPYISVRLVVRGLRWAQPTLRG